MTIGSEAVPVRYNGNDVTVAFAFGYKFDADTDLVVVLTDSDGTDTTQILGTNYSVTGAGVDAGGTVTMVTAPATGEKLTLRRLQDVLQETDLDNQGAYFLESLENALDTAIMVSQQQQEQMNRSVRISSMDSLDVTTVEVTPAPNAVLGWDSDGTAIVNRILNANAELNTLGVLLSDFADLDAAAAALAGVDTTLYLDKADTTSTGTMPSTVTIVPLPGFVMSSGVEWAGPIADVMFQWLSGSGHTGFRKTDFLRPEWFGATGDYNTTTQTGTDDAPAFQLAVDVICSQKLSQLRLSNANYYFANTVTIESPDATHSCAQNWQGPNGAFAEDIKNLESAIYGSSGLDTLIDLGGGGTTWFWSQAFYGVKFLGTTSGTAVGSAIKITSAYPGPTWPVTTHNCFFKDFTTSAIFVDNTTDSLTYNSAFYDIQNCAFTDNAYALLLDDVGITQRAYGLMFMGNRCHQNTDGVIKGAFGGPVVIEYNNLEANPEPINITGVNTVFNGRIQANYFESVTGDFNIKVIGLAAESSVLIGENTYLSTQGTTPIMLAAVSGAVRDNVETAVALCNMGTLEVRRLVHVNDWHTGSGSLASTSRYASDQTLLSNFEKASQLQVSSTSTGVTNTPFGMKTYKTITTDEVDLTPFPAMAITDGGGDGDFIVASVLVRTSDLDGHALSVIIFADGAAPVKQQNGSNQKNSEWTVQTFVWERDVDIANLKLSYYPYGTSLSGDGVDVAAGYVYVSATREYVPFIERTDVTEPVEISASSTTIWGLYQGKTITNTGSTGTQVLTLQSAYPGMEYTFKRTVDEEMRITPASGETIIGASAADKYLLLNAVGDSVKLKCLTATEWEIVGGHAAPTKGTGTIANLSDNVTKDHDLGVTPVAGDFSVILTNQAANDPGFWWINSITSTQFNIQCLNAAGAGGLNFSWNTTQVYKFEP